MATLTGKRKAALLLASLDQATATEILKGQPQEVIQELAMELAHLDAAGQVDGAESNAVTKEFCAALERSQMGQLNVKAFVSDILKGTAGKERASELHAQMQKAIREKDPFIAIAQPNRRGPGKRTAAGHRPGAFVAATQTEHGGAQPPEPRDFAQDRRTDDPAQRGFPKDVAADR